MVLPYKKWTDDEIDNRNACVPEGYYPFVIKDAVQMPTKGGVDKDGNEKPIRQMLVFNFDYHDSNGVVRTIKDWIVFIEGMDWKLRHAANTCGLLEFYDDDRLEAAHFRGKQGVFTLGIKEVEKEGVKNKVNFVKDYVKKAASSEANPVTDGFHNDDVQF